MNGDEAVDVTLRKLTTGDLISVLTPHSITASLTCDLVSSGEWTLYMLENPAVVPVFKRLLSRLCSLEYLVNRK